MTDVHHLILTEHEVEMLEAARETMCTFARLARIVGAEPTDLEKQAAVVSSIALRLGIFRQPPIRLTPDPEPEVVA